MAILNVTPDSFSDGGQLAGVDDAVRRAESVIAEGADILDIGGESTRPGSSRVSAEVEVTRVVPVIEAIAKRFDTPISIDTSKAQVASHAVDAGAEIINDVSGLRWDPSIAGIAAAKSTGLVLMHSLGEFETMHTQEPVADIVGHVIADFNRATAQAATAGVNASQIVLDIGIGFGKTFEQNLELLANIDKINAEFPLFPILAGASRKSFIGKILDEPEPQRRLNGSVAAAVVAVTNGAKIVRVHDVKETVDAVRIADAIRDWRKQA
jgi:dihydropteroate synthase